MTHSPADKKPQNGDIDVTNNRDTKVTPGASHGISADDDLRLLADSAHDYAMIFTDPERNIVRWSAGAEHVLGWTEAEAVHKNERDLIYTPEDQAADIPQYEQDTALREGRAEDDRWHMKKDGTRFFATGVMVPLRDPATGTLRGFGKVLRDQTQQHEQQEALRASAEKDRRIAQVLQRSMLIPLKEKQFPGMAVATLHEVAWEEAEVGGDFYDGFLLNDTLLALAVGDASGKGLLAAVRTTQIKDVLRAFLRSSEAADAADTMARLNNYLCESKRLDADEGEGFVCLSLVLLNTATGEATFVVAGAEPPLVLRTEDGRVETIEKPGLPLGVFAEQEYPVSTRQLEPGDAILLVTDGVTEARRGNQFLNFDDFADLARKVLSQDSVLGAAQGVLDGAKAFAGGKLHDDACLLLAQRVPLGHDGQ